MTNNSPVCGGSTPAYRSAGRERYRENLTPQSHAEAEMMARHAEPPNTFTLNITGHPILLPKYNGISWWFPAIREDQSSLEYWISFFFHVVESMQSLSLLVWPAHLVYQQGLLKMMLGMMLAVPLGLFLEHTFGKNKGSAYASFQAIYITFQMLDYFADMMESYKRGFSLVGVFIVGTFLLGSAICILENVVGRTSFAVMISLPQLMSWLYAVPWISGRLAFLLFLYIMIRHF